MYSYSGLFFQLSLESFYLSELLFNENQFINKKKITVFDWFGLGGSSVITYKSIISLGLPIIICRSLKHFLFLLRYFFLAGYHGWEAWTHDRYAPSPPKSTLKAEFNKDCMVYLNVLRADGWCRIRGYDRPECLPNSFQSPNLKSNWYVPYTI